MAKPHIYNYTNQTDLFTIAIGFIGALVGGLLSYIGVQQVYKNQINDEKKAIAKAIDIDLKTLYDSPFFSRSYNRALKIVKFKPDENALEMAIPLGTLYDDKTLLYFVFSHDIVKFDINLSSEIFEFYNDLFSIEKYSRFIKQNLTVGYQLFKDSEKTGESTFDSYKKMNELIIKCGNKIPELRKKLQKVHEK
jgi:hypothetical protein